MVALMVAVVVDHKFLNSMLDTYIVCAAFWCGVGYKHFRYRRWIEACREVTEKGKDDGKLY